MACPPSGSPTPIFNKSQWHQWDSGEHGCLPCPRSPTLASVSSSNLPLLPSSVSGQIHCLSPSQSPGPSPGYFRPPQPFSSISDLLSFLLFSPTLCCFPPGLPLVQLCPRPPRFLPWFSPGSQPVFIMMTHRSPALPSPLSPRLIIQLLTDTSTGMSNGHSKLPVSKMDLYFILLSPQQPWGTSTPPPSQ